MPKLALATTGTGVHANVELVRVACPVERAMAFPDDGVIILVLQGGMLLGARVHHRSRGASLRSHHSDIPALLHAAVVCLLGELPAILLKPLDDGVDIPRPLLQFRNTSKVINTEPVPENIGQAS